MVSDNKVGVVLIEIPPNELGESVAVRRGGTGSEDIDGFVN